MGNKTNLFKLFTQDISFNYHLIKTEEPNGHLIYVMKNGDDINQDTLEFSPTIIVEELISLCLVKIEKFTTGILFTEEFDTEELKEKLNIKLSENPDFSIFIEQIKDDYRSLEIKDSLLYKRDPEAYEAAKQKEHIDHQNELWEKYAKEIEDKKSKREESILAYNNNLIKLLKDILEDVIEYEKQDFNLLKEIEKIINNIIDPETWIKINDQPYACRIEICSLEQDKMNVFMTDNNDYSYTATLRFDKTVLITENVVRINKEDELPKILSDYDILSQIFDFDLSSVEDWEFKNDTDKIEYTIDYLVPIFKKRIEKKEKEYVKKVTEKENLDKEEKEEEFDLINVENNLNQNNMKKKNMQPSDWYFDVEVAEIEDEMSAIVALSKDGVVLDDSLGSHSLSQTVIDALNRAGVDGECELMEAMWEVVDTELSKEDIIKNMEKEGFVYSPGLF